MTTVKITPYKNDYVAEVEILNKKLSKEEIKNIQYKLNTYWVDEEDYKRDVAYKIKDYDDNKCIVEFPKSCFINNDGGYDFEDVIEEIVKPVDNIIFAQISSVIRDVDVIQWVIEEEMAYYEMNIKEYEKDMRKSIRKAYEDAYDDDLYKIDYISSVIWSTYEKKPINSFLYQYKITTLDDIEDEMLGGYLYIYKESHSLIEDTYTVFDWVEETNNMSKKDKKFLQTIINYAENYQYDKAIEYITENKSK